MEPPKMLQMKISWYRKQASEYAVCERGLISIEFSGNLRSIGLTAI